ncbi:hypothetical protein HY407_00890 [Candidatus Gottesmanbacteria bacterium]|nr:hypothetical protein [Candidatus Gottesmanbacteria bacterium]
MLTQQQVVYDRIRNTKKSLIDLDSTVDKTHHILFKTSTLFPFDLFPDTITIDEIKVNITRKEFFSSEQIQSILIDNISDVEVETAPILATLVITHIGYRVNPVAIKNLKRADAIRAKRIIQGLIILRSEKIDTSSYTTPILRQRLVELGRTE